MFNKIENGKCINVQGLDCWIPPEGYVFNIATKKLEHRGVFSRSKNAKENYWERTPLPNWYKDVMKQNDAYDKTKKDDSLPFYDERLEQYKSQEWDRRLNGFWFYNFNPQTHQKEAVYLTGKHYMYLQWWQIDIGYPKFRFPDLDYFYFQQYCIEDSNSMGMLEITKRRFGKTFRGGLFLTEMITRTRMANAGIQSKTGNDAKKVFAKAVVSPFKKLPRFFRPEYDMSLGVTPKTEMRFQQTNVRGKKAEDNLDKEELGSMIDWGSSDTIYYDGQKLSAYFSDEWAKVTEINIYDRHEVIRYCLLDDEGRIIGKALYSSTVEQLDTERDGIQDAAIKLWDDSDQNNKQANGRTPSGLYRFFMTADRSKNFDVYGYPDVQKTISEILADRETVKHNQRTLIRRIKKEARTIEEAFSRDADECIFNVEKINAQRAYLKENPIKHFRYIKFIRDIDQTIKFIDIDPEKTELYWKCLAGLDNKNKNNFRYVDNMKFPNNTSWGVIGIDGYSNNQGGKIFGSKMSGWLFIKPDIADPENTGLFAAHLYGRPNEKKEIHDQVLMASEYWGVNCYYEFVADDYYTHFKDRGRLWYLGKFPKNSIDPVKFKKDKVERHYGFPTNEFSLTKQNDTMISYILHYSDKIYFEELLEDLLKFKPYKRTPSDRTVSAMITLVSSMELIYKPPPMKTPIINIYDKMGRKINNF